MEHKSTVYAMQVNISNRSYIEGHSSVTNDDKHMEIRSIIDAYSS
jgi:hypothetical protein